MEFYRWADPVLGPRRTPNCEKPLEGLEPLATTSGQLFSLESGQVRYGGLELGPGLVFRMATSWSVVDYEHNWPVDIVECVQTHTHTHTWLWLASLLIIARGICTCCAVFHKIVRSRNLNNKMALIILKIENSLVLVPVLVFCLFLILFVRANTAVYHRERAK